MPDTFGRLALAVPLQFVEWIGLDGGDVVGAERRHRWVIVVCVVLVSMPLMGCLNAWLNWNEAADEDMGAAVAADERSIDLANDAYSKAGLEGQPRAKVSRMTQDHEITAQFILQQQGRNTDLSSYKSVKVVTLTKPDGTEILAVVLNGEEAVIGGGGK